MLFLYIITKRNADAYEFAYDLKIKKDLDEEVGRGGRRGRRNMSKHCSFQYGSKYSEYR